MRLATSQQSYGSEISSCRTGLTLYGGHVLPQNHAFHGGLESWTEEIDGQTRPGTLLRPTSLLSWVACWCTSHSVGQHIFGGVISPVLLLSVRDSCGCRPCGCQEAGLVGLGGIQGSRESPRAFADAREKMYLAVL